MIFSDAFSTRIAEVTRCFTGWWTIKCLGMLGNFVYSCVNNIWDGQICSLVGNDDNSIVSQLDLDDAWCPHFVLDCLAWFWGWDPCIEDCVWTCRFRFLIPWLWTRLWRALHDCKQKRCLFVVHQHLRKRRLDKQIFAVYYSRFLLASNHSRIFHFF